MRMELAVAMTVVAVFAMAGSSQAVKSSSPFNITKVLAKEPDYSKFNEALTRTKLADEVNSRQTITVLALDNADMSALDHLDLNDLKMALSKHIVLDFYDAAKLHDLSNGTTLTTTLYQTTGNANGNAGFVNITDVKGGKVAFGPAEKGSKLPATFVKSVDHVGYNLSVIQISQPIQTSFSEAPAPSPSQVNITAVLVKGGCKIFAGLLASKGVLKTYEDNVESGLTVFAPTDEAFKGANMKAVSNLTDGDMEALLEYHARPVYSPMGTLKISNGAITTLASSGKRDYVLKIATVGNSVTLSTGIDKAHVMDLLEDQQPLAIFSINKILKPKELFHLAPTPAPAPAPAPVEAPTETPVEAPSPADEDAEMSPSDAPSDSEDSKSDKSSSSIVLPSILFLVIASLFVFFF